MGCLLKKRHTDVVDREWIEQILRYGNHLPVKQCEVASGAVTRSGAVPVDARQA